VIVHELDFSDPVSLKNAQKLHESLQAEFGSFIVKFITTNTGIRNFMIFDV
jgi:hypothetical protein